MIEDFATFKEIKDGEPIVIDARTGGVGLTTLDRWNKSQKKKAKSYNGHTLFNVGVWSFNLGAILVMLALL